MRNSSPLLINEYPLQVLPTLAVLLGLNEAMILQQIHFWLCNKDKRNKPYVNEDETWVYNTYEEWHEQFPFWSVPTIKRAILNLEEQGVLVTRQFDKQRGDAKKYYRIDHEKLTSLLDTPSDQIDPTPEINLISPSDQIDPTVGSKRSDLIRTETTTETTSEGESGKVAENPTRPKLALVSSVGENPTPAESPFSPNDDFSQPAPKQEWTIAERFVLKACYLWDDRTNQESPAVETNWKTKQAVHTAGSFVAARLDVAKRIGGTPTMFLEFWHDTLKRSVAPRPDYVVEQWAAYDRWLIENHETHRRVAA